MPIVTGRSIDWPPDIAFHSNEFVEVTEADLYPRFQEIGVEIYSVSTETHWSHMASRCPARWTPGAKALAPSLDLVGKI